MQAFVNGWIGQCQRHGLSAELIVVDWNLRCSRERSKAHGNCGRTHFWRAPKLEPTQRPSAPHRGAELAA
jgi:hypothetical protein